MFPSKFLQFPSILTHFHAANEKIQNGGRDLAISRGLVWVNIVFTLNPVWISNLSYYKVWDEIINLFPNSINVTVKFEDG